jgi:hypothetical protein
MVSTKSGYKGLQRLPFGGFELVKPQAQGLFSLRANPADLTFNPLCEIQVQFVQPHNEQGPTRRVVDKNTH